MKNKAKLSFLGAHYQIMVDTNMLVYHPRKMKKTLFVNIKGFTLSKISYTIFLEFL